MAHCVGTQGQEKLAKKSRKYAMIVTSPQKNPNQNEYFFSISTIWLAESVDALNSSQDQSAGE